MIEIDYEKIREFKKNEHSDEWCLTTALKEFTNLDRESLDDKQREDLILWVRMSLYDAHQHKYLGDTYGVSLTADPVNALGRYVRLVVDAVLPQDDPRRLEVELAFKGQLLRGTLEARHQIEEKNAGKPLIVPKEQGLIIPGRG